MFDIEFMNAEEQRFRNIIAIRNQTGLKHSEVETRIKDLDSEEQSLVVTACTNNNDRSLSGKSKSAYNSIRAGQNFNLFFGKNK